MSQSSVKIHNILSTKDCLSTWIQNNQFIARLNNNKINQLQNEIINAIFGDFTNLLKALLKDYNNTCLTHYQQLQLNNILSKIEPNQIALCQNDKTPLLMLPNDCFFNIIQFTDYNTKLILQYCCKTLLIMSRKSPNWNTKERTLSFGLNTHTIAALILSDNSEDNLKSIKLMREAIIKKSMRITYSKSRKYRAFSAPWQKLFACHKNVKSQLASIINKNIDDKSCQHLVLQLKYYNNFVYQIIPSFIYMLQSSNSSANAKMSVWKFLCAECKLNKSFMFNILNEKHSFLWECIFSLDHNKNCEQLIDAILSFGFSAHIKSLLKIKCIFTSKYWSRIIDAMPMDVLKDLEFIGLLGKNILNSQINVECENKSGVRSYESSIVTFQNIINKIDADSKTNILNYILNNATIMSLLSEIMTKNKIEIGAKLLTKDTVEGHKKMWYKSEIIDINDKDKKIKIHYVEWGNQFDEWVEMNSKRFGLVQDLQLIYDILMNADYEQKIGVIRKGYFMDTDIYIGSLICDSLNDQRFKTLFDKYKKRWNIFSKYLQFVCDKNIIATFKKCVFENQYSFEHILNDVNRFANNESVIISSMRKQLNWNKAVSISIYCILKLLLITEIFDFNYEYIEKCICEMVKQYYNNNISQFPFIPSTKYVSIIMRIASKSTIKSIDKSNMHQSIVVLFGGKPQTDISTRNVKSSSKSQNKCFIDKCKNKSDKKCKRMRYQHSLYRHNTKLIYKYYRKRR